MSTVPSVHPLQEQDPKGGRARPSDYFADGAWPSGPALPGSPRTVLYVAELAAFLRAEAVKAGASLTDGLPRVAGRVGVPVGTLRHIADGDRWPGIEVVALVELAYRQDISGYSAVLRRLDRQATADHAGAP